MASTSPALAKRASGTRRLKSSQRCASSSIVIRPTLASALSIAACQRERSTRKRTMAWRSRGAALCSSTCRLVAGTNMCRGCKSFSRTATAS